ncbi:MAG: hypothetical protein WCY62_06560 [Clostridia bacterium]
MKKIFSLSMSIVLLLGIAIGSASCTKMTDRPSLSVNTENSSEDIYTVTEAEYDIATYGEGSIMKPKVEQFKNISRQKTLNAKLVTFNEMITMDMQTNRNRQLYDRYEIRQINCYLFSCQYFTAFETTVSNRGVNMLVGSGINGTLLMNLPALLGTDLDSDGWNNFMILFNEARVAADAKEITKEQIASDDAGYVFIGEDLMDLTLLIMYKTPGDTEQQEVSMKLNDIMDCLTEKMQVYFTFTKDASMTYEEYALILSEYEE